VYVPVTLGSSWLSADLLKRARSSDALVVVVTDTDSHGFLTGTDHVLVAFTKGAYFHWSMVAGMAVLEVLVVEVAAVSPEETRRHLETTDRFRRESKAFSWRGERRAMQGPAVLLV
jgi:DNA-binding MurR/RpiR family transcriptional regulator